MLLDPGRRNPRHAVTEQLRRSAAARGAWSHLKCVTEPHLRTHEGS